MGRSPCCEKVGLKKGRWTTEEDQLLTQYIQANGEGSWRSLPKNAGLLRCGKSCRLRWVNYLRADLKRGNITPQEEETIVKLHTTLGNRWSLIGAQLPGRTDNEIKNYWNSHLSRKIYSFSNTITGSTPGEIAAVRSAAGAAATKKRGGRTSRSSNSKKHKPPSMSLDGNNNNNNVAELASSSENKLDGTPQQMEDTGAMMGTDLDLELNYGAENIESGKSTATISGDESSSESAGAAAAEGLLGPYEWLDSEIERLAGAFQCEGHSDPTCGDGALKTKGGRDGLMGLNEEREATGSSFWSMEGGEECLQFDWRILEGGLEDCPNIEAWDYLD